MEKLSLKTSILIWGCLLLYFPVTAQGQPKGSVEQSIQIMWKALGDQDKPTFMQHISGEWQLYTASGNKVNVGTLFDYHSAHIKGFELEKSNMEVHRVGNFAWVTYDAIMTGRHDGSKWGGNFIMTNIFKRQGDRWVCIHMHESKRESK